MSNIVRNPLLCSGSPTIAGTRLTVYDVVEGININGFDFYIETFDLKATVAQECVTYCANLRCKDIEGEEFSYCYGCILNKVGDSSLDSIEEITLPTGTKMIKNGSEIFFGSFAEYLQSREKIEGWKLAESIILGGY